MTARVLNLGLLKAFSDFKHLVQVAINHAMEDKRKTTYNFLFFFAKNLYSFYIYFSFIHSLWWIFSFQSIFDQDISRCEDTLSTLKAMQGQGPAPQLEMDIARLEKEIELYSQEKLCYEAQILRVYFCLTFIRLCYVIECCIIKLWKKGNITQMYWPHYPIEYIVHLDEIKGKVGLEKWFNLVVFKLFGVIAMGVSFEAFLFLWIIFFILCLFMRLTVVALSLL